LALTPSCSGDTAGFPQIEGWTQTGEVRVYTAENLWEYIDGAAVLFEEYGVRTCTSADLVAEDLSVTVDLYEMGSPLAAVGVFRSENSSDELDLPGATVAAVAPPYQALMVKGGTYAKVNVYEGQLTDSQGYALLEGLASSLPGETAMPAEFSLLPEEGRVAGSEGYQPGSLLSLEELRDCVHAWYEGGEGEGFQGFVVLPSSSADVWAALAEQWNSLEYQGLVILYREVPYSGLVGFIRTDSGMFGVSGAADEAQLGERLAVLAGQRQTH